MAGSSLTGQLLTVGVAALRRSGEARRELFKVGGELVSPKEVEDLLTGEPGVAQAYVAGVPDDRMGEIGWAWVISESNTELDVDQLRRVCWERLAPYKVPRHFVLTTTEELPTTTTGKVQKYRLIESARQ